MNYPGTSIDAMKIQKYFPVGLRVELLWSDSSAQEALLFEAIPDLWQGGPDAGSTAFRVASEENHHQPVDGISVQKPSKTHMPWSKNMDSVAILGDGHQPTDHVLTMAHMHVCNLQTLQNWGCQLRVELGGKTQAQMEIQGHGPDLQRVFSKCLWGHCSKLRVELQRENEKKLVFSGIAMGLILSEKKPWNFNGIISLRRTGIVMGLFHEGKSSYNGWLMRIPSWIVIISICQYVL